MATNIYPFPQPTFTDPQEGIRQLSQMLGLAIQGKLDIAGDITLGASTTTTTITDPRIGPQSVILLSPTTENAKLEHSGMINLDVAGAYISTVGEKTATITHSNHASTDRIFRYLVFG